MLYLHKYLNEVNTNMAVTVLYLVHNWFVLRNTKNIVDLLCIEVG